MTEFSCIFIIASVVALVYNAAKNRRVKKELRKREYLKQVDLRLDQIGKHA